MDTVGSRIKYLRLKNNLNQKDFCKKINLGQSRLSEIESDKTKPSFDTLISINKTFDISLDWLMLGVENYINEDNSCISNLSNNDSIRQIPSDDTFIDFSKRLKYIIDHSPYDQKEVANIIGISEHSFTKYLNGRIPQAEILYKIASFYGTTMEWLLTGIENRIDISPNSNKITIGDRIRYLRNESNLSMAELAEIINVSSSNISDWENGKTNPSSINLLSLSNYFKASADWLLTGESYCLSPKKSISDRVKSELKYDKTLDKINAIEFGKRLKFVIEESNTTQKSLAKQIGISQTSMTNYVNGRIPEINILYALSKILGVSIEWFLTGKETIITNIMQDLTEEDKKDLRVFLAFLKERRKHNSYESNYILEDSEKK